MRCSTPKRCCSSITASARSLNATSSWKSAWVPTTMSISPSASRASSRVARAALLAAGQQRELDARRLPPAFASVAKCWRARISVGAISAACAPASTASSMAEQRHHRLAAADIALQQPQHARRRRHVAGDLGRAPGAATRVSAKGSAASDLPPQLALGLDDAAGAAAWRARAPARWRAGWRAARHRRGAARAGASGARSASLAGACTAASASLPGRPLRAGAAGRRRSIPAASGARSSAAPTAFCTVRGGSPAVRP